MTAPERDSTRRTDSVRSRSFQFTIDDGPESLFALCIEDPSREDAWLVSDTVCALKNMR